VCRASLACDERPASVAAAPRALAPREREIVLLKFHSELTNGEFARVLGISESNAGTRLHRGALAAARRLRRARPPAGRMKLVRFPQPHDVPGEPSLAEIEAALHGDAAGPGADYWRRARARAAAARARTTPA
jgi:Sigma-70, region 4